MVLFLILSAFEFSGQNGHASGMFAGAAVPDAMHSFFLNPALAVHDGRLQAGASYSRPYGLPGLDWGRAGGVWSSARFAAGVGLSILGLDHYSEQDVQVVVGATPMPGVAVGLGIHALVITAVQDYGDLAPAFDAGVCWRSSRVRVGAAGLRLNAPRLADGVDLPTRVILAGSWQPVDEVLLALDLGREGSDEDAAFGAEFRLAPQLGVRMGVGVVPLRLAGGIGATVGPVGVEYAYQFHPTLKETHVLGLRAAWR